MTSLLRFFRAASLLCLLPWTACAATGDMPAPDKEAAFWRWFAGQSERFLNLESDRDNLFRELTVQLHRVDPGLTFEFSRLRDNGKREFVVSADGNLKVFDAVKRLVAAAPTMEKWAIVAFRPPSRSLQGITLRDRRFGVDGAYFRYGRDGAKLGIQLLLPGYSDDDEGWKGAAFLLLDGLLGEYATEMFIGFVEMKPLPAELPPGSLPLSELPAVVEAFRQPSSN